MDNTVTRIERDVRTVDVAPFREGAVTLARIADELREGRISSMSAADDIEVVLAYLDGFYNLPGVK